MKLRFDTERLAPVACSHLHDHLFRNRDIPFPLVSCRVAANLVQNNADLFSPSHEPDHPCGTLSVYSGVLLNRTCEFCAE